MTKDEIKATYSMYDILTRYGLQVNRKGFLCCPFHHEKTPSMQIKPNQFRCFGCGESGDIFSFVGKIENISFKEAFSALGGNYENENHMLSISRAKITKQRAVQKQKEEMFRQWKEKQFRCTCELLRSYDQILRTCQPLSDIWMFITNKAQILEYQYQVLGFGSHKEQEEMMRVDG